MGRRLAANVMLRDPKTGDNVLFTPDSGDVPEWAVKEITNPDVWASSKAAAKSAGDSGTDTGGGSDDAAGGGGFDVAGANMKEVLEHVGEDQVKAQSALDAERARGEDARSTLVEKLEKLSAPAGQ